MLKQAALSNHVAHCCSLTKHAVSMLPIAASTFCWIFLFLYAGPKLPFTIEEIDDPDRTDCTESSQVEVPRGLSLLGVEHFAGLPRKLLSEDIFNSFDSRGVSSS